MWLSCAVCPELVLTVLDFRSSVPISHRNQLVGRWGHPGSSADSGPREGSPGPVLSVRALPLGRSPPSCAWGLWPKSSAGVLGLILCPDEREGCGLQNEGGAGRGEGLRGRKGPFGDRWGVRSSPPAPQCHHHLLSPGPLPVSFLRPLGWNLHSIFYWLYDLDQSLGRSEPQLHHQ